MDSEDFMTDHIKSILIGVLALLLLASAGVNVLATGAYIKQRDAATVARKDVELVQGDAAVARAAAEACSAGVYELGQAAATREANSAQARQQAAEVAEKHNARADAVLAAAPAVPGNACASAQARAAGWLAERKTGGD